LDMIIAKIYEILKDSANLMEAEENLLRLMHRFFADALEKVLSQLNETIKKQKQGEGWKVERNDQRSMQFLFGTVTFTRTLMTDPKGNPHYPLDECLGIQKYERRSPLVDVKIAELASKCDYWTVADILAEWTDVKISHGAVRNIVNKVGMAQARQDEALVKELEESAELPQGKKVDVLFSEADGVYIRSTERKKGMEVRHAVIYEGWEKNGNRVSLKGREVIMTTKSSNAFWTEVQAMAASRYSLEKAQVVTNSDGGAGYTAEKFREAFAQSENPVIHQLDPYHVYRNLSRVFGPGKSKYKDYVLQAIKTQDRSKFEAGMDTYESTLNDPKRMKKSEGIPQLYPWKLGVHRRLAGPGGRDSGGSPRLGCDGIQPTAHHLPDEKTGDALEPDGRRSHGQNHPGDHESNIAKGLFERQTTKRPKTAGSQENRKDERIIA